MTHAELSQVGLEEEQQAQAVALLGLGLSFCQELLCHLQFFTVV